MADPLAASLPLDAPPATAPPPAASSFDPLPQRFLTADQPGIGGRIKVRPEDFLVEEIPAYQPVGAGEHLYLFIEKIGRPTLPVVREIARAFRVRLSDVGYAGLKDKHAVTRQLISVHTPDDMIAASLSIPGVTILSARRHRNKLRQGHLAGNRFVIRIRDVSPTDTLRAARILDRLSRDGVPNFIGAQRFGYHLDNHEAGRFYLLGDFTALCNLLIQHNSDTDHTADSLEHYIANCLAAGHDPRHVVSTISLDERRFFLTAFQSAVFNHVLAHRLDDGTFDRFIDGDLAYKHDSGAVFAITPTELADPDVARRLAENLICPSGPLWGPRMLRAAHSVDALESAALQTTGVTLDHFTRTRDHAAEGARRPLRIPVTKASVESGADHFGPYVQLAFDLPRGAFATTILREITKQSPGPHPCGPYSES